MDSANFLQQHLETEGLFRKSGSIQRQKLLKVRKIKNHTLNAIYHQDTTMIRGELFFSPSHKINYNNHLCDFSTVGICVQLTMFMILFVNLWELLKEELLASICITIVLYNNQVSAHALIGQSAVVYCASEPMEKSCVL